MTSAGFTARSVPYRALKADEGPLFSIVGLSSNGSKA